MFEHNGGQSWRRTTLIYVDQFAIFISVTFIVPDTTSHTPEDECKWIFTAIWFILLKQIDKVKHGSWLQSSRIQQIIAHDTHNYTYSVHKGALVSCWARSLCLRTSWERLTSSTVWCQFPILFSDWRAGSPSSPCIQHGPLSPRVPTHLCPLVCYIYCTLIESTWCCTGHSAQHISELRKRGAS